MNLQDILSGLTSGLKVSLNLSVGSIIRVVFLVLAGVILIRILTKLVGRMLERSKALASLRVYILSVFRIGLWFLLVLIAAESVGIPTASIIALLSVAGCCKIRFTDLQADDVTPLLLQLLYFFSDRADAG